MSSVSIVWFRLDLRLSDNPALTAAALVSRHVIPVYIHAPKEDGSWSPGAASCWWLHQSLSSLDQELRKLGSRLIICKGDSIASLLSIIKTTGADSVFYNRLYAPYAWARDIKVEAVLRSRGVSVESFNSSLLHEPHVLRTQSGNPFRVFTQFWNNLIATSERSHPFGAPQRLAFPEIEIASLPLEALELEPRFNWTSGMSSIWKPGETGAFLRLVNFTSKGLCDYATGRDRPDQDGVSMMSPHLHFGEIGPRQIWHAISAAGKHLQAKINVATYLKELGWREFAHHVLFNFPETSELPLRRQFQDFPWCDNDHAFERWKYGQTGFPIVDAGMRQLWKIGWMHNRVRMIVASFLTKDLLVSWKHGAQWFWDTLVDADLASNTFGWQWTAGCGADAAPYFRIFNPVLQGEKFDPKGAYVRQWLPELSRLPDGWIHRPWLAPQHELESAGVKLGSTYPQNIIDHAWARNRALAAFAEVKG